MSMGNSDNGNTAPQSNEPELQFWFDFASTYSYLSAMRIEQLCAQSGVAVRWKPFLLGPIFSKQGWDNSPFNIYPAKGRYMIRDMKRQATAHGLPFLMPEQFPAHSLKAARIGLICADEPWGPAFIREVFSAQFSRGQDIAENDVLIDILKFLDVDPAPVIEQAFSEENKPALRNQVARAESMLIFGAPTFVCPDGELFWGDDRLEMAIDYTADAARPA